MFVSDLRHFLDMPDTVPGPARRMGELLGLIVQTSTTRAPGIEWVTTINCGRRPNHRVCAGTLEVSRNERGTISWECTVCHDDGIINGWEHSTFDQQTPNAET